MQFPVEEIKMNFKKGVFAIFLALVFGIFPGGGTGIGVKSHVIAGEGKGLVEGFRKVAPAVGALYSRSMGGDLTFKCTVTAVKKQEQATIFLTAYHCVSKDVAHLIT